MKEHKKWRSAKSGGAQKIQKNAKIGWSANAIYVVSMRLSANEIKESKYDSALMELSAKWDES